MVKTKSSGRRCFGLDVHRDFAQVAIWQDGRIEQVRHDTGRVRAFADSLGPRDEVALEATGNTWAIATLLQSRAGRVVVSNPAKTRAIAEAKVKTDLLTELATRVRRFGPRRASGVVMVPVRDHRWGWAA